VSGEPTADEGLAPVIPLFRVTKGDPSAEEIAALTAVLAAMAAAGGPEPEAPPRIGRWNDPRALVTRQLPVGPGSWTTSGFEKGTRTRAAW
jgi:Acyl-CoA carboxylase epsilon subunit